MTAPCVRVRIAGNGTPQRMPGRRGHTPQDGQLSEWDPGGRLRFSSLSGCWKTRFGPGCFENSAVVPNRTLGKDDFHPGAGGQSPMGNCSKRPRCKAASRVPIRIGWVQARGVLGYPFRWVRTSQRRASAGVPTTGGSQQMGLFQQPESTSAWRRGPQGRL